ncbi:MAG TPA: hypothetical protein VFJ77_09110 [Gaiellaceae bacterium]|nr:hypothetical protein [Gaiellaceae bacterium]
MADALLTRLLRLRERPAPERVVLVLAGLAGLVTLWNVAVYPSGLGYDAASHREYADFLIQHHRLPHRNETPEYYSPPLYYLLAGAADWIGRQISLGDPHKLGQVLNIPAVAAAVLLTAALARLLWPRRPWLAPAAAGFVALSPVLERTAAMFHPEPLDLALGALAGWLAARILVRRNGSVRAALALGAVLGLAQMVRQFALYVLATVVLAWLAALWRRPQDRTALARSLAVALAAVVVLAGPWYAYRAAHYGNAVFDRPHPTEPLWERRPASFYLGSGLPDVLTSPYRPNFVNRAWPQTYSDIWGDWYGVFAWQLRDERPSGAVTDWLTAQTLLGIVPTALALAGWLVLLAAGLRRRSARLLLVGLLPLAGLAGYFYFAIGYPTPDGDVLKPTFMLATLWAWALCFARAACWCAERAPRATAWTLGLLALADLPFLIYRGPF